MDGYYWKIAERIPGKGLKKFFRNNIAETPRSIGASLPCVYNLYYFCRIMQHQANNPLHGKTLEMILNALVAHYGWQELGERIRINCFISDPSIKSSLKFLRKTEWARKKVEELFIATPYLHHI